jgi:glycosyltransferase involved in cell wall biosynthesis
LKLLHVISTVNPESGGPIEGLVQLETINEQEGHTIEVASGDPPDASYLKSFPFRVFALGPTGMKYGYNPKLVPWLKLHANDYEAIVVNGIWQYHSFAVRRALANTGVPYVVFTHGMLDPWFKERYPLKHIKKMLYWPWGERRVLRDAAAVFFTCEEERVRARQSFSPYECNEVVVNYGTAGPGGDPRTHLDVFHKSYPELRNKRLAIFLGRLHEKKGCDLLIQAFARVLAQDPEWHLLMCGPDQVGLKVKLESLAGHLDIQDRITWINMVRGDMKWGALRASEIFILPSHQENFGIVVAEALACSVPVLISNRVNIWREIESDGAGIVGADDLEGTCIMLRTWLQISDEQREQMRVRARECFEQRFEIHQAATTLIGVLSNVVADQEATTV